MLKDSTKNIFFDLDNTLWDFKRNSLVTLEEIYNDHICAIDHKKIGCQRFIEIFEDHNEKLWDDYRKGMVTKDELRSLRFMDTFYDMGITVGSEIACSIEQEYVTRTSYKPNLVDNAIEVLDYLCGKYHLGIITNGFIEAQEIKLKNTNIERYFEFIVVSEKAGASKPDPAIFDYAFNTYNLARSETVYVGDDFNVDMVCANNSGIPGIWLNRGSEEAADLKYCVEIKNLLELKNIF